MSQEERQAFEKELKHNTELAKDVAFLEKAYEFLRKQKQRDKLKESLNEAAARYRQKRGKVFWLGSRSVRAVAATLALLLVSIFVIKNLVQQPSSPTYADLAQHPPLALTQMSADHSEETATLAAEQAFNSGNYAQAAQALQRHLQVQPEDQLAQLYLAISFIETDRLKDARNILQSLTTSPDFRDKALWYLALSYIKEGNEKQAKTYLKDISPTAKEYQQAQRLLK